MFHSMQRSADADGSHGVGTGSSLINQVRIQELLGELIRAEDPDRSRAALSSLVEYGDAGTQELMKMIRGLPRDSADLPRVVDVLVQLSAFSREAAKELVNLALYHDSPELRRKAALGMPRGIGLKLLGESLERGDGESSFRAATALGIMGEAGVVHLGRALEHNPSLAVQLECVNWLGKILAFSEIKNTIYMLFQFLKIMKSMKGINCLFIIQNQEELLGQAHQL
jgi:hypothetical protein